MADRPESNIPWWAIILGFLIFPPAGLVLLLLNLGGVSLPQFPSPQQGQPTLKQAQQAPASSAVPAQKQAGAAPQAAYRYTYAAPAKKRLKEPKPGRAMTSLGALLSVSSGIGFVSVLSAALPGGLLMYAPVLSPLLALLFVGMVLLFKGVSKTQLCRRMKLYQGIIGQRSSLFLSDLAGAVGVSESRVIADLQRMISDGYLPLGYIDRTSGKLVLTDQGYEPPAKIPETNAAKEAGDADQAVLRQIREINNAIPNPEMSRKIARIEEITGKILDYQKKNPAKAPQLRQFLNYYLPTTLKILNAYARMDAQGVEGENISAAKARIEGMMDKVVEGFEKQLDQLFQADAMDIASDVDVLERMLDRDGLGSGMPFGSGG